MKNHTYHVNFPQIWKQRSNVSRSKCQSISVCRNICVTFSRRTSGGSWFPKLQSAHLCCRRHRVWNLKAHDRNVNKPLLNTRTGCPERWPQQCFVIVSISTRNSETYIFTAEPTLNTYAHTLAFDDLAWVCAILFQPVSTFRCDYKECIHKFLKLSFLSNRPTDAPAHLALARRPGGPVRPCVHQYWQ